MTKIRTVKVNEELLQNARTLAPLASYAAITNDALREWIEKRMPKAAGDERKL